jgi:hypothetical protein
MIFAELIGFNIQHNSTITGMDYLHFDVELIAYLHFDVELIAETASWKFYLL